MLATVLSRRRRSQSSEISALAWPSLAALTETDTPADGYVAGTYTSSEGTISSAAPTYYVNGGIETGSYDLQPGDVVLVRVLVTDSVGNTRTFTTNQSLVPGNGAFSTAFSIAFAA